jgi:hypothetical protein
MRTCNPTGHRSGRYDLPVALNSKRPEVSRAANSKRAATEAPGVGMPSASPIDPLAQLAKDLAALEREPAKPTWDPSSVDSMVDYAERELGVTLRGVPKVLAVFVEAIQAFQRRERLRLAVLGPRGGGKTKLTAAIELVAYRWFGYSWQNVGGSLEQAKLCYSYVKEAVTESSDLAKFTVSTQVQDTRSRKGDSISVSAASQTSVRGPHPVGSGGGGGLTLDEAAIIPDDICDAAKGQLTTANPSALIQLSTMGETQAGRFWDLVSDPSARGYKLMTFDVFDVARRCKYDCATTCPVKEHFANDCYEGSGETRQLLHKAYCAGKAHETDGWIDVDEIAQQFRELDRGAFERELMGKAVASVGAVYDPVLLDAAVIGSKALAKDPDDHERRFQLLEKAVSIDWGYSGQLAVVYAIRLRDALLIYRWDTFTAERFSVVREHVLERCFAEHIEAIYPDAANPSDNDELHHRADRLAQEKGLDWSPRVFPVVFSKWKPFLLGEVRRRLEQGLLKFARGWGGRKVAGLDSALRALKAYRYDDSGRPIKVNDHIPDALGMVCVGFSPAFRAPARLTPR